MNRERNNEFAYLFMLALAVLLGFIFIAPATATGFLGRYIGRLGFALMGTMTYVLPFLLMYFALEGILKRQEVKNNTRRFCLVLLFLLLAVLLGVLNIDYEKLVQASTTRHGNPSALKSISVLWQYGNNPQLLGMSKVFSSGLLGGMIAMSFLVIAGRLGSLIILLSVGIALVALILDTSISSMFNATVTGVKKTSHKLRDRLSLPDERSGIKSHLRQLGARILVEDGDDSATVEEITPVEGSADYDRMTVIEPEYDFEQEASDKVVSKANYDLELKQLRREYTRQNEVSVKWLQEHLTSAEHGKGVSVPEYSLPEGSWRRRKITEFPCDYQNHPLVRVEEKDISPASIPHYPASPNSQTGVEVARDLADHSTLDVHHNTEAEKIDTTSSLADSTGLDRNSEPIANITSSGEQPIPATELEDASSDRAKWQDRSDNQSSAKQALASSVAMIKNQVQSKLSERYTPPSLSFLVPEKAENNKQDPEKLQQLGQTLEQTLKSFGVDAKVLSYTSGPTITRFEIAPGPGVKVSKILNLTDDIALALAATGVRMEAPIPGKSAIGIEIPNAETQPVLLSGLLASAKFRQAKGPLIAALGRDIQGSEILCDLGSMPHLLIAGATGSGKSVCINSILISLLYRTSPEELKLLMIDPKVVELSIYNGIPHLLQPVVTDPKKAYGVLNWAVQEMTERYNKFAQTNVRDFNGYNDAVSRGSLGEEHTKLPKILIIIDELSDLMATSASEVENAISRLTAMARAAGIHLIIATQRPSVDVITGVIKANIPSRIAFAVASQVDSRTILDIQGAEKLLGRGDMLYFPQSYAKPLRGQGAFITDAEVESVVTYLKTSYAQSYDEAVGRAIELAVGGGNVTTSTGEEIDDLLEEALQIVIEANYASTSMLQRRLSVGYPRASRIIDQLHELGYIGPFEGSKPRKVTITMDEYLARKESENGA